MNVWLRYCGPIPAASRERVRDLLASPGIELEEGVAEPRGLGVLVFAAGDSQAIELMRDCAQQASPIGIAIGPTRLGSEFCWELLAAGALDLVTWPVLPESAEDVLSRLRRRHALDDLMRSARVRSSVAGTSAEWLAALYDVVEAARFTRSPVLIGGETGTGKEQLARLVHDLADVRPEVRGRFVVLDCSTVVPELSGSEFFGHERGAFTGATGPRDGAFALAHGGTLFLDEIGELSLPLQAQLLRVIQEKQYKRLGSNAWQESDFRLVCATHRDLEGAVREGRFRADLYHRISAWRCTVPSLRERREDILPLARFFLRELGEQAAGVDFDPAVTEYLLTREYPGNVRELRHIVTRLWQRHSGSGPFTVGDVPPQERPQAGSPRWPDRELERAIRHAVELGVGLKDIGQIAADLAVRFALEIEGNRLARAAARLGVTDRALQIRRKERACASPAR